MEVTGDMQYRRFGEHEISALVLGTVQFGLDYGVANTTGKPDQATVNRMLATAFDAGVNTLDTASMYNDAETVLGRALGDLGMRDRIFICSKARPHEEVTATPEEQITAAVERSLRVLGVERIGLYLLHGYQALPYVGALHRKREAGDIGAVGVSVYSVEEALGAIATPGIDAIQHPLSILDQRFLRAGVLERAAEAGVAIFARSVYLQGVVTMAIPDLPEPIAEVGTTLTPPAGAGRRALNRGAGAPLRRIARRRHRRGRRHGDARADGAQPGRRPGRSAGRRAPGSDSRGGAGSPGRDRQPRALAVDPRLRLGWTMRER